MPIQLRPATTDEYESVGALTLRAYRNGLALHDDDTPYAAELLDAGRRAREAELLVADDDDHPGDLLATVTVCRAGTPWAEIARSDETELRMLAVAVQHQGRGVAHEVMTQLRALADSEGSTLVVSVIDMNAPAHRLYASLGFVRCPDRDWEPSAGIRLQVYRDSRNARRWLCGDVPRRRLKW